MQFLYNLLINSAEKVLPLSGNFNEKMKLFVEGRKHVFPRLENEISADDRIIWIHAASLGEYEQAVPVIKELRKIYSGHKILLSFFSPSGYEIKKKSSLADVVTYLPLDTKANAEKFLDLAHPELVLFIKYEFWPNYLQQLQKRGIETLLVSGSFREDQIFFKSYGSWMRSYLKTFSHFFVQNKKSEELLKEHGFQNVSVSGDTRFDRVSAQLEQDNQLDFMERFKGDKLCVVAGSTWPEDEDLLLETINSSSEEIKFVIAPHALKPQKLKQLQEKLQVSTARFSEKEGADLERAKVLIVDTIGLLSRVYSYADMAYVGGAAGDTGLHNILEPATFGLPVVIGKNFDRFPEAKELQELGGLFSVADGNQARIVLEKLIKEKDFRRNTGQISKNFIEDRKGAIKVIVEYLLRNSQQTI